jgi:cell division protease FtsH
MMKSVSLWIVIFIILVLGVMHLSPGGDEKAKLGVMAFDEQLQAMNVESVKIMTSGEDNHTVEAKLKEPVEEAKMIEFFTSTIDPAWKAACGEQGVTFEEEKRSDMLMGFLINFVPFLLVIGLIWFFMFRQMQGGNNKAMSFGKSRARLVNQSDKVVTFEDVAGVDEAKEELQEIIEFLRDPKKFSRLGGKIPKGVLLVGPPGSGKTLLARAVAGEAHVPFFSISGSDFVEMFVGVGASRVRDLFQQGQKHAPCIIFIDEIDAVGRQRGAGLGGGHDEREQTLNQLLVEMDGFNTTEGVILVAATNRPDVLDKALLRPGRFDRQIMVANPDIKGREAILNIHIRNNGVPLEDEVDCRTMARGTPGFSGADLANLVNEAALLAARREQEKVTQQDFEDAKDRVLMGPERRSLVISAEEKRNTAVHEGGHALVGRLVPGADPVHKVTVIPRGPALGLTSMLPVEDRHTQSQSYCLAQIRVLMGGRAAEEVVLKEFTNGASNDLKRATQLAHLMVCQWGMSELGPISFGSNAEVFLGRDLMRERDFSEETAATVDRAIHRILDEAYAEVKDLIIKHSAVIEAIAETLCDQETLEAKELDDIIRSVGGAGLVPEKEEEPTPAIEEDKGEEQPAPEPEGDDEDPGLDNVGPGPSEPVPGTV